MLARMSSWEFQEWKLVYDKIQPFGDYRADLRAGLMISPLLNLFYQVHCKDPKLTKASDWIIDLLKKVGKGKTPKPQSMQEMQDICRALAKAYGVREAEKAEALKSRKRVANVRRG